MRELSRFFVETFVITRFHLSLLYCYYAIRISEFGLENMNIAFVISLLSLQSLRDFHVP